MYALSRGIRIAGCNLYARGIPIAGCNLYAFLRGIPIAGGQLVDIFTPLLTDPHKKKIPAVARSCYICHRQLLEGIVAHDGSFVEQLVLGIPRVCVCVCVCVCVLQCG